MREFTATPFGNPDQGKWPEEADMPQGAILQCRNKSPQPGFYYAMVESAAEIPRHRNIVAWFAIPAPIAVLEKPKQTAPTDEPKPI